jgi:uncharacterized protein (TIGR02246 family)
MPETKTPTRADAEIRECIETWARALRAKDIDALTAHYAPDIVTFDLMPLQSLGVDAYRRNFEAWFASVRGPIDYEIRDLRITASGDGAFCHYVGHVKSTRTTGEHTDYRVRVTMGLQQKDGRWLVTHEHVSTPFPSRETMQAALGPRPPQA